MLTAHILVPQVEFGIMVFLQSLLHQNQRSIWTAIAIIHSPHLNCFSAGNQTAPAALYNIFRRCFFLFRDVTVAGTYGDQPMDAD